MTDDLRHRYAEALIACIKQGIVIPGPPGDWHAFGPSEYDLADSVLAVRDTELEQLRAAIHTYENTITWFTTCHGCAKTLDSSYAETVRAEKAEAALVHAKALHSRDDSNPHGPWCGTCTTHWPCRTWIALLSAEEQTGDGRG